MCAALRLGSFSDSGKLSEEAKGHPCSPIRGETTDTAEKCYRSEEGK